MDINEHNLWFAAMAWDFACLMVSANQEATELSIYSTSKDGCLLV